ncbi:MAG: T9SS type A sorting domain-containing protein [Flavobacteriales bacterium]
MKTCALLVIGILTSLFAFSESTSMAGGCQDPQACNYNVSATFDDGSCCYDNCVIVSITPSSYSSELGYQLVDDLGNVFLFIGANGANQSHQLCLPEGCYNFIQLDTYGDGWNGAAFTISYAGGAVLASGDFPNTPAFEAFEKNNHFLIGPGTLGCNDPLACNYDAAATCNDGSCDYISCYGCTTPSACNYNNLAIYDDGSCCMENCAVLELIDYVGDGWDDGIFTIETLDGDLVVSGTLAYPLDYDLQHLCLPDGCYLFSVSGSAYPEEIEWSITIGDQVYSGDGLDNDFAYFSLGNSACYGCTDPSACTYNPWAMINDDSCIYGPCVAFDNPWTAKNVVLSDYPICSIHNQTLVGATTTAIAQTNTTTGEDIWFRFQSSTIGARFEVQTNAFDCVLELLDENYNFIRSVNLRSGVGGEILNCGDLTPGQFYFLGVRNMNSASGTGTFALCCAQLKSSSLVPVSGTADVCATIKCNFVGAGAYSISLDDLSSDEVLNATSTGTTKILLSSFNGVRHNRTYAANVTANFYLTNTIGQIEVVNVPSLVNVNFTTASNVLQSIPASYSCSNGAVTGGPMVKFGPFACTASGHQIEFINTNGLQEPVYFNVGTSRVFRLNQIAGLTPGQSYNVRCRPIYNYTYDSNWGPAVCMQYAATSSLIVWNEEQLSDLFQMDDISDEYTEVISTSVYPNPASKSSVFINLIGEKEEDVAVMVFDMTGKQVFTSNLHLNNFAQIEIENAQSWSPGVYSICYSTLNGIQSDKLIILE